MKIIPYEMKSLVMTPALEGAIAAYGPVEYERIFNEIFTADTVIKPIEALITDDLKGAMEGIVVMPYDGKLLEEHWEKMCLHKPSDNPINIDYINGTIMRVDASKITAIDADVRQQGFDFLVLKEGVYAEQVQRGDMIISDVSVCWNGVEYLHDDIYTGAVTEMHRMMDDGDLNSMTETDAMLLIESQYPWELECNARVYASLSHVYEMTLSDTQRNLVDQWVVTLKDTVIAYLSDDETVLSERVWMFQAGTKVGDIIEWTEVLFGCKWSEL